MVTDQELEDLKTKLVRWYQVNISIESEEGYFIENYTEICAGQPYRYGDNGYYRKFPH